MDVDIRPCSSAEEVKDAIARIAYCFRRSTPDQDHTERLICILPAERVYA